MQNHDTPTIALDGVTKRFGDECAVDDITLAVNHGELCVLVGTSGCGKSTTLRMINRLIEHSDGQIRIEGQQIRSFDPDQLRRRIGYAIQSTGLFPHWSVSRNIGLVPRLLKWPPDRIAARVSELMAMLDLDPETFSDKYPAQLSGGQAQRVGVARALAADPDVLLMDEPFGALDPITRESLQDELLHLQGQLKKTIVFVTHDMDEALKLADRIVVMRAGHIVQQGKPADLLARPADSFVESLLGGRDLGLKHASLVPVAMRMSALNGECLPDDESVLDTDSLRDALSVMLWRDTFRLLVRDVNGNPIGILHWRDAIRGDDA
ncbi:ABC transporter ATP-binding protein [Aidingimonas lacisalsi]|uniref:ABC transporter ATP-binding protein n=1 Tax=Aidingimonas lacisalsi TaxID=2604086 RepID=UPI0011D1B8BA|nr:ABC transporter ATP-binding protein [Aidingimonas lacisalsi]